MQVDERYPSRLPGLGEIEITGASPHNGQKSEEVFSCLQTRFLPAKSVVASSNLLPLSRNSTRRRALPMSPAVARNAALHAKHRPEVAATVTNVPTGRCLRQFVLLAGKRRPSPSSPVGTDQFIAATAISSAAAPAGKTGYIGSPDFRGAFLMPKTNQGRSWCSPESSPGLLF